MAVHLLENVYQVGGENITDLSDGASYLIVDEQQGRHVLIDCGSQQGHPALARHVGMLGIAMDDIAATYGTHCHFDHVSGAASMEQTPLRLHQRDCLAVTGSNNDLTAAFLYNKNFPRISTVESIEDGYTVAVGRSALTAIHTPGHTPGSMCYNILTPNKQSVLITGDTLWGGFSERINSNLDTWETSLDKLLAGRFDYLSFGHGISCLVPRAMAHLALARSHFRVDLQLSHGGLYYNPWADPLIHKKVS